MYDQYSIKPEVMKQQLSLLPPIEQLELEQLAKRRKINFNIMLSLPFLLKDKSLEDRKSTIAIFRKKKFEPLNQRKQLVQLVNNGRIHCTELWADKYQNQALKESHIDKNLSKYKQIIKTNIQEYIKQFEEQEQQQILEVRRQHKTDLSYMLKKQSSITDSEYALSSRWHSKHNSNDRILTDKEQFLEKIGQVITSCEQQGVYTNHSSTSLVQMTQYMINDKSPLFGNITRRVNLQKPKSKSIQFK